MKEKQLNDDVSKFKTAVVRTPQDAKARISRLCRDNKIPTQIECDILQTRGFFNSKELDCLVISHPEHQRDYYKIVVVLGGIEVVLASTGTSKQIKKHAIADINKHWRKGRSSFEKIGNAIGGAIWLIGKSKNKLEKEQAYYNTLLEIIGIALELQ
jgi:hypothetical protein